VHVRAVGKKTSGEKRGAGTLPEPVLHKPDRS